MYKFKIARIFMFLSKGLGLREILECKFILRNTIFCIIKEWKKAKIYGVI